MPLVSRRIETKEGRSLDAATLEERAPAEGTVPVVLTDDGKEGHFEDAQGRRYLVQTDAFDDAFKKGLFPIGASTIDKEKIQAEYGSGALNKTAAFLAGAGRAASFGLSDIVGDAIGVGDDLRGLKEANPYTTMAGEVGGYVGSALVTGGASLAAKAGAGVAAGVGARVASPLAAKIAGGVTRLGIEGSRFGATQGVSDVALSEGPVSISDAAKHIANKTAEGVAINTVLGGALGGLGALGRAARNKADKVLNPLTKASSEIDAGVQILGQGQTRDHIAASIREFRTANREIQQAVTNGTMDPVVAEGYKRQILDQIGLLKKAGKPLKPSTQATTATTATGGYAPGMPASQAASTTATTATKIPSSMPSLSQIFPKGNIGRRTGLAESELNKQLTLLNTLREAAKYNNQQYRVVAGRNLADAAAHQAGNQAKVDTRLLGARWEILMKDLTELKNGQFYSQGVQLQSFLTTANPAQTLNQAINVSSQIASAAQNAASVSQALPGIIKAVQASVPSSVAISNAVGTKIGNVMSSRIGSSVTGAVIGSGAGVIGSIAGHILGPVVGWALAPVGSAIGKGLARGATASTTGRVLKEIGKAGKLAGSVVLTESDVEDLKVSRQQVFNDPEFTYNAAKTGYTDAGLPVSQVEELASLERERLAIVNEIVGSVSSKNPKDRNRVARAIENTSHFGVIVSRIKNNDIIADDVIQFRRLYPDQAAEAAQIAEDRLATEKDLDLKTRRTLSLLASQNPQQTETKNKTKLNTYQQILNKQNQQDQSPGKPINLKLNVPRIGAAATQQILNR